MEQKSEPGMRITYTYFMFDDHSLSHGGLLPDLERAPHACWYYCQCAHQHLQAVDDGATLEGELDTLIALNNMARSVAVMYQLNDPDEFLVYMPLILKEALRVGLSWDPRVLNPGKESFQHVV